eukprot:CAMPEP_0178439734 /NCGR_PEP_ID=MMETSP0689_2-20121128/36334_1 /TAXON_ID=160604 /ORGANISM="Amphidinium massartii, Strain CS-259" /LENGTH=739 /DNA_ID=CAMNT_0020062323 /DNA_START=62 /DNA_END=2281 /DNA_ORIENTATION=-
MKSVACIAALAMALAVVPAASISIDLTSKSSKSVLAAGEDSTAGANPIRRVVNMLQSMAKKIQAEQEKDEKLWEKYQCYCKTSGAALQETIAAAEAKMPQVQAQIEETQALKARLEGELKDHKAGREEAKKSMEDATAIREKEAAEYKGEADEYKANIGALSKAIEAVDNGMAGAFLQTGDAERLQHLISNSANIGSMDREELLSFFSASESSSEEYVPKSGEISGILKQIKEDMEKSLAEITEAEDAAKATYEQLIDAKQKEIAAHTKAIEDKTVRVGNAGVEITTMQADLSDTEKAMIEDKKFAEDTLKSCDSKAAEWKEISELRTQELAAIAETVKILNDDDALELFKKTLPTSSLMQVASNTQKQKAKALAILRSAPHARTNGPLSGLDFIAMALSGKKVNFDKVFKMIDNLIATLAKEQQDDDHKVEYCEKQLDTTDDKKKVLEQSISDLDIRIEEATDAISTLSDELKTLEKGIKALDKEVAEATETRKEEHEEYTELISTNSAAKQLIAVAKNRLNKFYNPKLYVPPPERKMNEEETIYTNFGGELEPTPAPGGIAGTGVMAFVQVASVRGRDAPPPPPESFAPYAKRAQESNGVIAMLDMLVADLDKEMTEAEAEEKNSQASYETFMSDAAEKRALDSRTITEKDSAKADAETMLQASKAGKEAKTKELMATEEYMSSLHADCDWLMQNHALRKEARAGEVDSLKAAKAVLSGADFSLVQESSSVSLRGSA